MTMKDCISKAAVFLQLEDVAKALEGGAEIGEAENAVIKQLILCGNLVLSEIACDYFQLKTSEKIVSCNREVQYKNFKKDIIDIYRVSQNDITIPIKQYYGYFTVPTEGEFCVEYSFLPPPYNLEDNIDYTSRISDRTVAYGIACEYCLVSGSVDEAVLWDKRYRDSLHNAEIKKNEMRVKMRRWS